MESNNVDKSLHKAQKAMLPHAEELGRNYGITLDYSDESIVSLDLILSHVGYELKAEGVINLEEIEQHEGVMGIAEALGCYIAECVERNYHKGTWFNTHPETGEPVYCFRLKNGILIFPMDWIMKKILDPKDYSVERAYKKWVVMNASDL